MINNSLTEKVKEVMSRIFGIDEMEIPDNARLEDFGPWTSLANIGLLAALEEQFGVRFEMKEMLEMTSLPSITELLRLKTA